MVLHVTERVVEQQDSRVLDRCAHSTIRHIFLEDDTVHVLTLLLVMMLDCDYLDEGVEIDGVIEHAR